MMDKLTFLETIEQEKLEAKKAQQYANLQRSQLNKRLGYLPFIIFLLKLIIITTAIMLLVRLSGYVTGEANAVCIQTKCSRVNAFCTLPKTGATIK